MSTVSSIRRLAPVKVPAPLLLLAGHTTSPSQTSVSVADPLFLALVSQIAPPAMNVLPSLRSVLGRRLAPHTLSRTSFLRAAYSTTPSAPAADASASAVAPSDLPPSPAAAADATPAPTKSARVDALLSRQRHVPSTPRGSSSTPYTASWRSTFNGSSPSGRSEVDQAPKTAQSVWQTRAPEQYSQYKTTTSERSFPVSNQNPLAAAYRRLNKVLMENNVRKEVRRGERFEGKRCVAWSGAPWWRTTVADQ